MKRVLWLLLALPLSCFANEQEIQRALVERDQRTAEFAAGVGGNVDRRGLEILHERQLFEAGRPLSPDPELARQLLPYQRERMAREREAFVLRLPPPVIIDPEKPLALPRGPRHGVEPVPANRRDG
jgi:hypothetical protein